MHRITWIDRGESVLPRSSTPAVLVREDAPIYRRLIEGHLNNGLRFCVRRRRKGGMSLFGIQISHDWHCLTGFCPKSLELSFVKDVAAGNGRDRVELHKMAISSWEIVIPDSQTSQQCGLLHLRIEAVRGGFPVNLREEWSGHRDMPTMRRAHKLLLSWRLGTVCSGRNGRKL
jgi:hypothetical protein